MEILKITKRFIAVNKPSHLPTTYINSTDHSNCVVKKITKKFPKLLNIKGYKPREGGLLYRLDNETSGLLLFARTQQFFNKFRILEKKQKVFKHYYAICINYKFKAQKKKLTELGFIKKDSLKTGEKLITAPLPNLFQQFSPQQSHKYHKISVPIGHSKKTSKKMVPLISANYKCKGDKIPTTTWFTIVDHNHKNNNLLIKSIIKKGARHQIRVHLDSIGLPILGDSLYSRQNNPQTSLQLHCSAISTI